MNIAKGGSIEKHLGCSIRARGLRGNLTQRELDTLLRLDCSFVLCAAKQAHFALLMLTRVFSVAAGGSGAARAGRHARRRERAAAGVLAVGGRARAAGARAAGASLPLIASRACSSVVLTASLGYALLLDARDILHHCLSGMHGKTFPVCMFAFTLLWERDGALSQANGVPFVLGRGRRAMEDAVAQFRAAPAAGAHLAKGGPARTLLLLIKQGANGLNLTGARAR